MEKDILFKKATFGGFDKDDVMNYIAKITDEFQAYKKQTVRTIDKLKEKIDELEKNNLDLQEQCKSLHLELAEHNEINTDECVESVSTTDEIKSIIESLYDNINGFISTLSDNSETVKPTDDDNRVIVSTEEEEADDELLKLIDKYVD